MNCTAMVGRQYFLNSSMDARLRRTLLSVLLLSAVAAIATAQTSHYAGKFTSKSSRVFGAWRIVDQGEKHWVHFNRNFKVTGADEVDLYLSPKLLKEMEEDAVLDSAILIVELKSTGGEQEHAIPEGTDLEKFDTILLVDRATGKLLGGAQIHAAKLED